jgi:hypothetical protein
LREQENEQWRSQRQQLRQEMNLPPLVTDWIAILVVTDNCTRQCLGLPLFVAGSHDTAEMVVAALRVLLPQELQFLISDRGVHFTADVFQQLAKDAILCMWSLRVIVHNPTGLPNDLFAQSKNGWLIKPGTLTRSYPCCWIFFIPSTTTGLTRVCPVQAYRPMSSPNGCLCNSVCLPF